MSADKDLVFRTASTRNNQCPPVICLAQFTFSCIFPSHLCTIIDAGFLPKVNDEPPDLLPAPSPILSRNRALHVADHLESQLRRPRHEGWGRHAFVAFEGRARREDAPMCGSKKQRCGGKRKLTVRIAAKATVHPGRGGGTKDKNANTHSFICNDSVSVSSPDGPVFPRRTLMNSVKMIYLQHWSRPPGKTQFEGGEGGALLSPVHSLPEGFIPQTNQNESIPAGRPDG